MATIRLLVSMACGSFPCACSSSSATQGSEGGSQGETSAGSTEAESSSSRTGSADSGDGALDDTGVACDITQDGCRIGCRGEGTIECVTRGDATSTFEVGGVGPEDDVRTTCSVASVQDDGVLTQTIALDCAAAWPTISVRLDTSGPHASVSVARGSMLELRYLAQPVLGGGFDRSLSLRDPSGALLLLALDVWWVPEKDEIDVSPLELERVATTCETEWYDVCSVVQRAALRTSYGDQVLLLLGGHSDVIGTDSGYTVHADVVRDSACLPEGCGVVSHFGRIMASWVAFAAE